MAGLIFVGEGFPLPFKMVVIFYEPKLQKLCNGRDIPQKNSRLASLGAVAILLVSSPLSCAFICPRQRHTHSPPPLPINCALRHNNKKIPVT